MPVNAFKHINFFRIGRLVFLLSLVVSWNYVLALKKAPATDTLSLQVGKAYNLEGIALEEKGQLHAALRSYYQALYAFERSGDQVGVAHIHNNIGLIYQLQKNYERARYYFLQSLNTASKLENEELIANAWNNLAICYQEQGNPEKALMFFRKVYELDQKNPDSLNLSMSMNNIGVALIDMMQYVEAKRWLLNSASIKAFLEGNTGLGNTYGNLATAYLKTGKMDSAGVFVKLAIKQSVSDSDLAEQADAYRIQGEWLMASGNAAAAYSALKQSSALRDSLNRLEVSSSLAGMEEDLAMVIREKTANESKLKNESRGLRKWLGIVFVVSVIVLLLVVVYYYIKVRRAFNESQQKQRKIEVQNKILQVKNIEVMQAKEAAEESANVKSQFISTISHEIRTPLNAIIGVTNLLHYGNPKPDQLENLNILKVSSENLLQLVENLLDFSKLEAGKLQLENIDFNLRNLVLDVRDLFSVKAAEKGLELLISYDERIPQVLMGDPMRLNQLLINLVNNAIKFTERGVVRLEVKMELSTLNNALVHFTVSDTGIGIPANKQKEIFEQFTQADSTITRKYGGTGLGLSICKRILENLNSKLILESEEGKGTSFSFALNFEVSRNAVSGKRNLSTSFENAIKGKRVLIVEDNMMNILVIRQFLEKWEVKTEIALNGKEGVQRVKEGNFDAVLMDIHMPEMDGIEATQTIRAMADERKKNIPIIALTAENELQFRQRVYEAGMNDYIFKPFNPDDLRERLGYALYNSAAGVKRFGTQNNIS